MQPAVPCGTAAGYKPGKRYEKNKKQLRGTAKDIICELLGERKPSPYSAKEFIPYYYGYDKETGIIRPVMVQGRGRFTKNADHTEKILFALDLMRIKYVCGNDASKGGKHGDYIKLITKII